MMICQLQEMVKHGAASSIMRTGRVYAIKRTKEALRQKQKQRSGSGTSVNSREKIWILTLRIDGYIKVPEEFDYTQTIDRFKPLLVASIVNDSMDKPEQAAVKSFFETTDTKIPVLIDLREQLMCSKLISKEDTVQASRDLLKNHIMELYEVPLLRFMTNGSGEREKIVWVWL